MIALLKSDNHQRLPQPDWGGRRAVGRARDSFMAQPEEAGRA